MLRMITPGDIFLIRFEEALPAKFQYTQYAFFYYSLVHLTMANLSVNKRDGHFFNAETKFPGGIFHFNLKGVTDKMNGVQVDYLQYFAFVTYKAGCAVAYRHPEYHACV